MATKTPGSRAELVAHLRDQGIRDDRVLAAMAKVRREAFVRPDLRSNAYVDSPLPIAEGQTISQPYIVALMTEALALRDSDRVLEVGTGSGYQTAILAELCGRVVSIERHAKLATRAAQRLEALGYRAVAVHAGDGTIGWEDEAPYDGIIVTAGSPSVPGRLTAQLAAGGRLVIPVGTVDRQTLRLVIKQASGDDRGLATIDLGPCRFVPLVGEDGWRERTDGRKN